jgi:exopolysaccharide biosynthesis predicted pyruvyltransferase EpsI
MTGPAVARRPLAVELKARLHATLDRVVPPGARVALLDYPDSENVGDNAIWLGELCWLRESGRELVYACAREDLSPAELRRRLGAEGVILFSGGGNFGDLYPAHEAMRLRVLREFPDHKIVQLPETVNYGDPSTAARTGRAFAAHRDFTLLVRDRASVERAARQLGLEAILCPDMAFGLGALRGRRPRQPVTWLARRDKEGGAPLPERLLNTVPVDWLDTTANTIGFRLVRRLNTPLATLSGRSSAVARVSQPLVRANYQRLAEGRLTFGMRMIGAGRVLVTDRLHAHILAVLAGIPNILVADRYRKTLDVHDAWTVDSATVLAEDHEAAMELASRGPWPFGEPGVDAA